ncbi:MAG: 4-hydroxy-tetrahydrodipicolinate reductase [Alphaproteobacteria bacterium]
MKIGIAGYTGRVGQLLIAELQSGAWQSQGLELAGGLARTIPAASATPSFFVTDNPQELFARSEAVIDFTLPESTLINAEIAAKTQKALIIGTTGLSQTQEDALAKAAATAPIVYAANMSLGVNLLMALVEKAARALAPDEWDIEIFEAHHNKKIDSPSGTALALAKSAAKGRQTTLPEHIKADRSGQRQTGDIGFGVVRGGDVVGEHSVYFYGMGERLELTHRATNRALFARGALKAALWAKGKPAGLYSMHDVLGLS